MTTCEPLPSHLYQDLEVLHSPEHDDWLIRVRLDRWCVLLVHNVMRLALAGHYSDVYLTTEGGERLLGVQWEGSTYDPESGIRTIDTEHWVTAHEGDWLHISGSEAHVAAIDPHTLSRSFS